MMWSRIRCPECESDATHQVRTEWSMDKVEEVRVCEDCPVQFANVLEMDYKKRA